MKLSCVNLEEYKNLSNSQLRDMIVQINMELIEAQRAQTGDNELQAAQAYYQSLKTRHTLKQQQLKKMLKSLHLLAELRGL